MVLPNGCRILQKEFYSWILNQYEVTLDLRRESGAAKLGDILERDLRIDTQVRSYRVGLLWPQDEVGRVVLGLAASNENFKLFESLKFVIETKLVTSFEHDPDRLILDLLSLNNIDWSKSFWLTLKPKENLRNRLTN